jgi:hypothetical protein
MKKSKKTYALLALVLGIWGFLGFKIVGAMNPDENIPIISAVPKAFTPKEIKKRETFEIAANYRDPFLGTLPKSNLPKKVVRKKVVKKPALPKKNIAYSGSVGQNGSNNRMYFVSIDGQQHIMSKNESIGEVTLLWGDSESIKVKYPGHTETIGRQQ